MEARSVGGENLEPPTSVERTVKAAVGILALLQAAFTALGAANGSLGAVALNRHNTFKWALVVVTVGFLMTLLGLLARGRIRPTKSRTRSRKSRIGSMVVTVVVGLGLILVVSGVGLTAYAAIVAPIQRTSPTVDLEVVSTKPLLIAGEVTATGIRRGATFQVKAEGYSEYDKAYHPIPPLLYHAVLGSNAAGEIKTQFKIAVPPGKYDAVGVDAWSEREPPGPCGVEKGSFVAKQASRLGCAVVHVTGIGVSGPK